MYNIVRWFSSFTPSFLLMDSRSKRIDGIDDRLQLLARHNCVRIVNVILGRQLAHVLEEQIILRQLLYRHDQI